MAFTDFLQTAKVSLLINFMSFAIKDDALAPGRGERPCACVCACCIFFKNISLEPIGYSTKSVLNGVD